MKYITILIILLSTGCYKHYQAISYYEKPIFDELDKMELKAYRYVDKRHTISQEELNNNINYLLNNINSFHNIKISKKLYYCSYYITTLVDKKGINSNNNIYLLAINLKKLLKLNYLNSNNTKSINNLKDNITYLINSINNSKEKTINDFYNSIK